MADLVKIAPCGHKSCIRYTKCRAPKQREWYFREHEKNKEKLRQYRIKNRGKMRLDGIRWYHQNRSKILKERILYRRENKERFSKYRQQIKLECFNYYSNGKIRCNCCGEKRLEFLTIDHINNDGHILRKIEGIQGNTIYHWLKKRSYPIGYQVLCMNCNWGKRLRGICPHKIMESDVLLQT